MSKAAKERASKIMKDLTSEVSFITLMTKSVPNDKKVVAAVTEKVNNSITESITEAYYKSGSDKEKDAFFNALSQELDSEKFPMSHPVLYGHLDKLKLSNTPLTTLQNIHEKHKNFWKSAKKNPFLLFSKFNDNPFIHNIDRYTFPLTILISILLMASTVSLGAAALVGGIAFMGTYTVAAVVQVTAESALSIVTGGLFDQLIIGYKKSKVDDESLGYFKKLRETMVNEVKEKRKTEVVEDGLEATIMAMNDEEFLTYAVDMYIKKNYDVSKINDERCREEAQAYHSKKIIESIKVGSIDKMKFAFNSLWTAITSPMDNAAYVIVRAMQVIASPFLLALLAAGELAELVTRGVVIVGIATGLSLYYSILAILNLPLNAYDFANNLIDSYKENDTETNSNAMRPLFTEGHQSSADVEMDNLQKPAHHSSPIAAPATSKGNSAPAKEVEHEADSTPAP